MIFIRKGEHFMGKDLKNKEIGNGFSQRKDGRYEGRFTYKGKRYSLYDNNLRTLKEEVKNKKYNLEHSIYGEIESLTLNQWFDIWLKEYKKDKVKNSTLNNYLSIYKNHIKPSIGKMVLKDIKTIHIQKLYNELYNSGMSSSTIHETVNSSLSNILKIAQDNDLLIKNPCKGVVFPERDYEEPRVLSVTEQKIFLNIVHGRYYEPLYLLALSTGLRIGEITGLKWSDIDFERKELTVNRTLHYFKDSESNQCNYVFQSPKSKSSHRTIPLIDDTINVLKKHKLRQNENLLRKGCNYEVYGREFKDMVFYTKNNTPIRREIIRVSLGIVARDINEREIELAKVEQRKAIVFEDITPHTLRHSFTTRAFEKGLQPKTVQVILGHSSLEITMNLYTHVMKDTKIKEIDKLCDILKMA